MRHTVVGYFFVMAFLCISLGWFSFHPSHFSSPFIKPTPNVLSATDKVSPHSVQVRIEKVIDGDTVVTATAQKIRYIGINAPEVGQPFASDAATFNKQLVEGKQATLVFDVEQKDQYGRVLGYLFVGKTFVNGEMVKNGWAISDNISPNTTHLKDLLQDEQLAKNQCKGIWQSYCALGKQSCIDITSIHYDAKGIDDQNENDEWIEFKNTCQQSVSLKNWLLKDSSSSNSYIFNNLNLSAQTSIKLHSGCGTDTSSDIYWQCPQKQHAVWNNSGDTAMLFDSHGELLSVYKY